LVEPDPACLTVLLGVISLPDQHRGMAVVGAVVGARLTDRFVVAIHGGGSLTPAVAEHPLMLLTELLHVGSFSVGGEGGAV